MVSVAMPEVSSPREQLAERKGERSVRMQAEKKETGRDVVDTSHNVIKQVVYRSRRPELRVFLEVFKAENQGIKFTEFKRKRKESGACELI